MGYEDGSFLEASAYTEGELRRLLANSIHEEDNVAYHATSFEAVRHMVETGYLPGTTEMEGAATARGIGDFGDVYFMPRLKNFPREVLPDLFQPGRIEPDAPEFALDDARLFSYGIAMSHRICDLLGLDIGEFGYAALCITDGFGSEYDDAIEKLANIGLIESRVLQAYELAKKRSGIVLGLSFKSLYEFKLDYGDQRDDFRLNADGKGLPIGAFSSMELKGQEEKDLLKKYTPDSQ